MDNMDNFNHLLLGGMDAACEEKLIIATTLALSFVSNQRTNIVLQRNGDGIYSLRVDRQHPRDQYPVNRYTPYFTRREVTRKRKKLKVSAVNQLGNSSSNAANQPHNGTARLQWQRLMIIMHGLRPVP